MPRLKIERPEPIIFSTTYTVRITDINYGGHVGNDSILAIVHDARVQFLSSLGLSELDVGSATALIMTQAQITYLGESFHGDVLQIELGVDEVTSRSFELIFCITNTANGKDIARARTAMLGFNYTTKKVSALSATFLSKFSESVTEGV